MAAKYAKDQPAGFTNRIERVAIVGAGGHIGRHITQELLKTGKHTVTALTRPDSKSSIPKGVKSVVVDYSSDDALVAALKGQDYLIISLNVAVSRSDLDARLCKAAAAAGVPYVMPNQYGADVANETLTREYSGGAGFAGRAADMEALGLGWTALCCGFWYEHSLCASPWLFGFDFKEKSVTLYDRGETKINVSTWEQCGRGVAAMLSLPVLPTDEADKDTPTLSRWVNKPLYVSSWLISQRDMFNSVLRVWGDKEEDWKVTYEPVKERYEEGRKMMQQGGPEAYKGFGMAMYARVFFPNGDGDFESKHGLANGPLGLPKEDLDEHTKNAKKMTDEGWSYFG